MGEQDAQMHREVKLASKANMLNTADLVEKSVGQNASEELDVDMDIDVPLDSRPNDDINACSGDQLDYTYEQKHDSDAKVEGESELCMESTLQPENGKTISEADVKDPQFNCNYLNENPWSMKQESEVGEFHNQVDRSNQTFSFDPSHSNGDDSGTEEEQAAFMNVLENFFKERSMEFKPPKFYGEGLNCLKLWRAVTRLGGYDQVTSSKSWRQVGESFKPPKTCTTVSWSFRCFYEKALLEYEKHKIGNGELHVLVPPILEPPSMDNQAAGNQASGSGRARRDAAARAMQGWHSQRLLGNGEVADAIIKDKSSVSLPKKDKHLKTIGSMLKRKNASNLERALKTARTKETKTQVDSMVVDVGAPADWVKINVRRTKDCFEVYALVPGLLREEVHVQSDPAGRLIISGEPEQPDNPWGVTAFKKVITLPSRIDPHQTSAVVTLHGQLFVRAPFEQSES